MTNLKMSNYRWTICALLFFATTINYLDRQVLSLLKPLLSKEFNWTDSDYGTIVGVFSLAYAFSMLFAGRVVDYLGTKKGYAWSIILWSVGAIVHAFAHLVPNNILGFSLGRTVLAVGESGNFPAAIKTTAEYFPKKDRALATGIFNSGANVGAILAPILVPWIAAHWGWQWAFIGIGAIGFIWLIFWIVLYEIPSRNKSLNAAEYAYIHSDEIQQHEPVHIEREDEGRKFTYLECFKYKQTWAFAFGKFMTDGVWWFYLFWLPAYFDAQYHMTGTSISMPIAILYTITVIGSVGGGAFPTYFINKGYEAYAGRMRAMFIIALFPLVVLLTPYLSQYSYWWAVGLIAIGASAHQAWSANIFTTVSDMFPKKAIATITGIGGMAGGIGSFLLSKGAGMLFDHYRALGHIETGYSVLFILCALAYVIAWTVMKTLVPKMRPIEL
ncbi:MFS transporter [Mucilaginibacter daejeonensis]|uniref:MFS transporter n=1 Tax=Mucilaginibacter daejeonensis TaxID=398049 RepID=UPI001D170A40|nr:MFS transporter [Mucilaginibacter daejeonensis]UEG53680.1 MFS transporter [Mucilaginibacter daejeonensis]